MVSEGNCGSIAGLVTAGEDDDCAVASWCEEIEGGGALATAPEGGSFWMCWDDGGGGNCSSATAAARFVGHKEFFTWRGEYASKARQSSTSCVWGSKVK